MNKFIYTLLLLVSALPLSANITGQWRMHPTFNYHATSLADTPEYVYFAGLAQTYNPSVPALAKSDNTLFRYDKEGDEIVGLSLNDGLSSTSVKTIEYNPVKKYLVIVYNDYNIDIITDDGQIHNIPAIRTAQIPGSKEINSINFYPADNLAILATGFGYIAIDDEKFEIRESRNYNRNIDSAARLGDRMVIAYGGKTYAAPYSEHRSQLSDYEIIDGPAAVEQLIDMGAQQKYLLAIGNQGTDKYLYILSKSGSDVKLLRSHKLGTHIGHTRSQNGITLITEYAPVRFLDNDLKLYHYFRPQSDYGLPTAAWDNTEYYCVNTRQGLRAMKVDFDKESYTVTKDWALPNAPTPYISRGMAYHPRYGLLVNNFGGDALFSHSSLNERMLLNSYRHGLWTPLAATFRNPQQATVGANPMGLTIDIDNDKYIYTGSNFSGITRTNLDDPNDILHMSHPADANAKLPGYVKMHDDLEWTRLSTFTDPMFDANGVLWSAFLNWNGCKQFWYWTPEDRRASTDAAHFRPWKQIDVKELPVSMNELMIPLVAPVNRGILVAASNSAGYPIVVYDHNNTLDNKADDRHVVMTSVTDQDGGSLSFFNVAYFYEDIDSGTVWICCPQGIFYFQPRNALNGQNIINRVKVSRNDGTSLADYLLNNISVTHITTDGSNRKWISTNGAGLVVTTADARTVLQEFTAANSGLPSDVVFYSQYNPETNSMMISTDKGLVEFTMNGGNAPDGSASTVRAYPNPVTPDYFGYVTIDGLPDNALVKIVDSEGNLTRELGRAEAGSIQWDVLNMYGKRVRTGVYYVLSSTNNGEANVAKILVMN
ncbi:MAG: hypothetical protein K2M03_01935 [Muribaculaceae bacterium]|nr:hypothetical protein [Muribaculaceae bacterium]